jgi:hypothetical protein
MKRVQIYISGSAGQGKTVTAVFLERALRDFGFQVEPFQNLDGDADAKRSWLEEGKFSEIPLSDIGVLIQEISRPLTQEAVIRDLEQKVQQLRNDAIQQRVDYGILRDAFDEELSKVKKLEEELAFYKTKVSENSKKA